MPPPPTMPTPDPSPPPPMWSNPVFPLKRVNDQFVDAAGRTIWRWGAWDIYGSGWTIPNDKVLTRLFEAGVNFVGMRPGPQSADGPDGALNWGNVDQSLYTSDMFNMTMEVSAFDFWVIQHGYSYYPWDFADFQGDRLTNSQVQWLTELYSHLRGHRHVIIFDGNEAFKARPSERWFSAFKAFTKQQLPGVLVGTNAENRHIENLADYVLIHQDAPVGIQSGRPTGVNESGPNLTCLDWAKASQGARALRTFFDLWRSDMEDPDWEACLVKHAEMRRASGR